MITYYASDIINRSRQIADLENSDFITYEEEIALLNEAFTNLYQDMIQANASAYVKTILVKPKDTVIPDLYQIRSVNVLSGHIRTPIFQRPLNQSSNSPSYEIKQNKIHFNDVGGEVEIQYWPVPQTLSYPFRPYKLDEDNEIVCSNDDYYVVIDSDGLYHLKEFSDVDTDIELDFEPWQITDDYIIGSKLVENPDPQTLTVFQSLYDLEEYSFIKEDVLVFVYKGNGYVVHGGQTYSPIDTNFESPIEELTPVFNSGVSFNNEVNIDGTSVSNATTTISSKFPITNVSVNGDDVYIFTKSQYYIIANKYAVQEYYTDYQIITLTKDRFITRRLNKYYFKSALADTKLDFPNNIFFIYLAYILALCYCSKQNKDPSFIAAQALEAEHSFFDTVREDSWSITRITNCY